MRPLLEQSHYEILEIPINADAEALQRAYLIARATYEPDSTATYSLLSDEDASAILRRIEEAYRVLSDPDLRVAYDQSLAESEAAAPAEIAAPETPEREVPAVVPRAEGTPGLAPPLRRPPPPVVSMRVTDRGPRFVENEPEEFAMLIERATPPRAEGAAKLDDELEPEDGIYDGAVLRRIRMSQGIELAEVAARSKISIEHLHNIEEDRFDALPPPVYVRGFVREFARCLRLDPAVVARSYFEMMTATRGGRR